MTVRRVGAEVHDNTMGAKAQDMPYAIHMFIFAAAAILVLLILLLTLNASAVLMRNRASRRMS